MKVLIVDDEEMIRGVLKEYVEFEGNEAYEAADGMEAVRMCRDTDFDVIIMDVMMPRLDGFSAVKEIKKSKDIPVIMLSARGEEYDKLFGFEIGVDDYVTKPFSKAILLARIKAALRRPGPLQESIRTLGDLVLDHTTRTATVAGNTLVLTRSEFDLLDLLSGHPGRVYTRPQIIANIQGDDKAVTDRTVDTMMVGLRRKLGAWATHIETIRGIGYRLIP